MIFFVLCFTIQTSINSTAFDLLGIDPSAAEAVGMSQKYITPSKANIAVFLYFSNLSCTTCVSNEVRFFSDLIAKLGSSCDFVVLIEGHDPWYARNLVKIGGIKCPIYQIQGYTSKHCGEAQVEMGVLDLHSSQRKFTLCPGTNQDHSEFESKLLTFLESMK